MRMTRWACALLMLCVFPAHAHDTWMLAKSGSDGTLALALTSGMAFPSNETAIKPERVAAGATLLIDGRRIELDSLLPGVDHLLLNTGEALPASAVAWLSLHPRTLELDASKVDEYLAELGDQGELREQFQRDGRWREQYVKHVKALVGAPAASWLQAVGSDLEITLRSDLSEFGAGRRLQFQLTQNGAPVSGHRMAMTDSSGHQHSQTDANGMASFELTGAGAVLLSAIVIKHVAAADHEWASDFATLTFEVP